MKALALALAITFGAVSCAPALMPAPAQYSLQGDRAAYINAAIARTVYIGVYSNGKFKGHGSGVVLRYYNGHTYILTAAHVAVPGLEGVSIKVHRHSDIHHTSGYVAEVVKVDTDKDVALIRVNSTWLLSARVARKVEIGERIVSVGWPYLFGREKGAASSVTEGVVATITSSKDLRITSQIYYGNSGGPSFNARGELVGINVSFFGIRYGDTSVPIPGMFWAAGGLAEWLTAAGYGELNS